MMGLFMHLEVRLLVKSAPTALVRANEGFLARVDPLMDLHVEFKSKSLTTNLAFIRFFTGMDNNVSLKLVFIMEVTIAPGVCTSKGPTFMHFQMLFKSKLT
jgi:hypothetical protein